MVQLATREPWSGERRSWLRRLFSRRRRRSAIVGSRRELHRRCLRVHLLFGSCPLELDNKES